MLNASTLGPLPLRELADTECEDFARVLEVNLLGPFRLTKAIVGSMLARGGGLVVGLSSDAAVNGYPGWGAVRRLQGRPRPPAPQLGGRAAGTGVRFLSLDPGEMDTQMHADAMPDADRSDARRSRARGVADRGPARGRGAPPSGARLEVQRLDSENAA